ncbi:hypothetical protein AVEN_247-1 [Araneus ventricosus]|uniref:Uncharacterized protein n=1 Tax=Araneus ventricosus TaxID=182803 RepID=A0A4Y2KKU9_ARAVE|nr:hypothetical protein AVEN_247-1 [Araneus ventricosus]
MSVRGGAKTPVTFAQRQRKTGNSDPYSRPIDVESDIDIDVVPPETAEASDEEGNDNILNHYNDDLPCDTA